MNNNEEFVEETTENVEAQTTEENEEAEETEVGEEETLETEENEEPVEEDSTEEVKEEAEKRYTDAELDEIIARKLSRQQRKLERKYKDKYSRLEAVVNAGLGTSNIEEATNKLAEFYQENGVNIPDAPRYSEDDIRLLANAEADEFIKNCTFKELVEEVDDLANVPMEQLTERDKIVFLKLANERKRREEESAVLELGISKDKLNAEDFKEFSNKLNPELPIKEKYEMFLKLNPRKETKKIGSMKTNTADNSKVKEFYTKEEALRFTAADYDKYPGLEEAVENSMLKW